MKRKKKIIIWSSILFLSLLLLIAAWYETEIHRPFYWHAVFNNRIEEYNVNYNEYSLKFQQGTSLGQFVEFYTRKGANHLAVVLSPSCLTPCESTNINEISAQLSNSRRETALPYTGTYKYERAEIILDTGNYNHHGMEMQKNDLSIDFTGLGNLRLKYINEISESFGERIFFVDNINNEDIIRILWSTGENHEAGFYFKDDCLIYYFSASSPGDQEGPADMLKYEIFYRKE